MKGLRNILLVLLVPLLASGCATTSGGIASLNKCSVIGAGLGGAAGALVAEKAIAGVVPGGIVGAVLGYALCRDGDADGDGVLDEADKCPNTPKGAIVNQNGCPDADGDGVLDEADKCPNTPEGIPVDPEGCSPDSDSDGVADYRDECPYTLPGIQVKENGCAKCGQLLAAVESVNFDFNKAELRSDAVDVLGKVAKAIKNTETKVRVEGHTDNIGGNNFNLTLSKNRAKVVGDYLVARGVSADNIAVVAKGEGSPISSNRTKEGREKNRRAEIITNCRANAR
uniref:OmpA-OmpF porin, OOP family n=1 Tax=Candidatus Kentrum eta TaxID=2126337 RepID=A0A450UPF6_9GAMM|nr:MAG: OmpA-OmpF porin, OOP family [Candidatus Kentron sp. H]VFJ94411.1 MAG: OmpA-OmpF porin, OOP family [Candidatus Kentron sp. H]VFK01062.1 MAG: OmpA-OmpF porin, OOP family [Candidatus Kentron sp. H]